MHCAVRVFQRNLRNAIVSQIKIWRYASSRPPISFNPPPTNPHSPQSRPTAVPTTVLGLLGCSQLLRDDAVPVPPRLPPLLPMASPHHPLPPPADPQACLPPQTAQTSQGGRGTCFHCLEHCHCWSSAQTRSHHLPTLCCHSPESTSLLPSCMLRLCSSLPPLLE